MTIRVGPATSAETRELRHAVLRPGQPLGVLDSPDEASSLNVAAWDGDRIVGCVRIFPKPFGGQAGAWQLRSMAVDPSYQGRGVGRAVLDAVVAIARDRGATMLWANARTAALGFYERAGWVAQGEEFIHGDSGLPHYVITLQL
jgi:GNAT superfamily N-acetyltransferase